MELAGQNSGGAGEAGGRVMETRVGYEREHRKLSEAAGEKKNTMLDDTLMMH